MSNAVFNRVRHAQLTASQKVILLLLADYADDTGCTNHYGSVERLAFESCLTSRTVTTVIKQLEDGGLIGVQRVNGATSIYMINPSFTPEPRIPAKQIQFKQSPTPEIHNSGCAVNFTPETVSPLKMTAEKCSQFHPTHETDCKNMSSISPIPSTILTSDHHIPPKAVSEKKPKTQKTAMPSDFGLSEAAKAWATTNGHTQLEKRLDHFRGYATANGKKYANWDQAFMNAVRDDWAKLNGGQGWQQQAIQPQQPVMTTTAPPMVVRTGKKTNLAALDAIKI